MTRSMIVLLVLFFPVPGVLAGPPFLTDDPMPVDYRRAEFYLFSTGTHDEAGTSGIGPAIEFNYGILPDTMLHLIAPMAYDAPQDDSAHFGYGDTELGIKYRFLHQTDILPAIGLFPLIELPTGDEDNGLSNGRAQFFLPVWLQKDFGQWTTYGGGGLWVNPGTGNRNYWFTGILLQYAFNDRFYLGTELYYQTPDTQDGQGRLGINAGGGLPLLEDFQLLFSAGSGLVHRSGNRFSYYLGFYRQF